LIEEKVIKPKLTRNNFHFLQEFGIFREDLGFERSQIISGKDSISADLNDQENLDKVATCCLGKKLKKGILIHGGFFLGPNSFYEELKNMTEEQRRQIHMTSVLNVNQLYGNQYGDEELKLLQRRHGRFVNACLMATLTGAVCSDGLESGQMVSGVGGQYNFVSQAHALPDGRSILMLKSTRLKEKKVRSNLVWNYGHITFREKRHFPTLSFRYRFYKRGACIGKSAQVVKRKDGRWYGQQGLEYGKGNDGNVRAGKSKTVSYENGVGQSSHGQSAHDAKTGNLCAYQLWRRTLNFG
jgi:hypothetical protein